MKYCLFLIFFFVSGLSAETFVFGESYRTIKNKDDAYQTNVVWAQRGLNQKIGVYGWAQYSKTYQQTYAGLYVKPTSWLQVGAGTGQELGKTSRLGSFAYAAKGKYYAFAIYENFGKTGYWYLVLTDRQLGKKWGVGTHSQAFMGHGARVEYRLRSFRGWTPSIRPSVLWDGKSGIRPNLIVGIRLTYFKGE